MRRPMIWLHSPDADGAPQAGIAAADGGVQPAAPAPAAAAATEPARPTEPDAETSERTYSAAEMREVRNEARNLRARLRDLEQQAAGHPAALEAAQRDTEALRSQVAALSDELRGHRLHNAIAEATRADDADDLRGINPRLAARLIDGVEWGDDGRPRGLTVALRRLLKEYPEIAGAGQVSRPAQPPAAGAGAARQVLANEETIRNEKRAIIGAL